MASAEYAKLDVAVGYLDAAMQMYLEQKYFCAIHLAGAAAELFGSCLPKEKRPFDLAVRAERGLHESETGEALSDKDIRRQLNLQRNSVKHMNDGIRTISIDLMGKALWWIEIALLSGYRLGCLKRRSLSHMTIIDQTKCVPRRVEWATPDMARTFSLCAVCAAMTAGAGDVALTPDPVTASPRPSCRY
jgi:hypothetical protein